MSEKWRINRIGLVDFWYYDDQEFSFVNGRMLLRGSNGSGKSVTMQSVVPLLLDGNMRPERLDPFGSRDRKMSNYLLEEKDERDERTGYLYMEFHKPQTGLYHTIGMGIRARKGKNMDSWYFYISDGRRINRDFPLYKESDGKITLSRKELEYRIGNGGRVLLTQQEYVEHVNRQIFGFEGVEDYKELVDLLIQLRTPKLSKDFKPSVISEILSDSLQPLSEEDLRPMSEAIENMDILSTNLANKMSSLQAAEKINRQYQRYNEYMVREKASLYLGAREEKEKRSRQIKQAREDMEAGSRQKTEQEARKIYLEQERRVKEQERETLNASDAVSLKQREAELVERLEDGKQAELEKDKQIRGKEERVREYEIGFKKAEAKSGQLEQEIKDALYLMGEGLETVSFDEHGFFSDELLRNMEEEASFDTHLYQIESITKKLEEGELLLKEMEEHKAQREELLGQYDKEKKNRSNLERLLTEEEERLQEQIKEQKERFYSWNQTNKQLKLSKEVLQAINRFLDEYELHSDYHVVKAKIADAYFDILGNKRALFDKKKEELIKEEVIQAEMREELRLWQEKKDPKPEEAPAVIKNRERLNKKGIPYERFFEAIDFDASLTEEQTNQLEEALLEMGLLDALIIDLDYKEQVLALDPGCCDRYVFARKDHLSKNLSDYFIVSDDKNDIFGSQRILSVLGGIGTEEGIGSYISMDGTYGMGVLTGTITGEYQAKYIGGKARLRYRMEQIERLNEQLSNQEEIIKGIKEELAQLSNDRKDLQVEYEACPTDESLHEQVVSLSEKQHQLELLMDKLGQLEALLAQLTEKIKNRFIQAKEVAEAVYLECRLDIFVRALEEMKDYYKQILGLRATHAKYLQVLSEKRSYGERVEEADADVEQLRYEQTTLLRQRKREELTLTSIREQLALTNYEEIKDKLDACLKRLEEIPQQLEACIKKAADGEYQAKKNQEFLEQAEPELSLLSKKTDRLKQNLKNELALSYTSYEELAKEEDEEWEKKVQRMYTAFLQSQPKEENKESLSTKMNQVFYENRGYLLDFNPNFQSIFDADYDEAFNDVYPKRLEITARYRGETIKLGKLMAYLQEEIEEIKNLIKSGDKELFEDILANTIGRKIRSKINASMAWVEKMNQLMESMNTSSGLKLSLRWRSKTAEIEDQLDTKELVELLKKDARLMNEAEFDKLSAHFRSKVAQARRTTKESSQPISFFAIMRDTLDYRKWFEFQLYFKKSGEAKRELTNSIFGTFSGGEKAMAMYVPLFSAVVAKYQGGRADAPRIVSLDEAFAGVDSKNIRDMFRLMSEFEFNFVINSQVLWGDCDTLDGLAIYQLYRPNNQKFVTVMSFVWNGKERKSVLEIKN